MFLKQRKILSKVKQKFFEKIANEMMHFQGLLTVDPSKRLTIKDLTRNAWLRGSSISTTHEHCQLLLTPSILSQASRSLIVSFISLNQMKIPSFFS